MPLIASELKDNLISELNGVDNANDALSLLGDTISTYIVENALINFAWVAANPSGTPDPVVVAQGEIVSLQITLTPSLADNSAQAFTHLIAEVTTSFALGTYNITDDGFVTSPGSLSTSPSIGVFSINVDADNQEDALLQLAQAFITYIQNQIPTAPCSGVRIGIYTGTGTVVSIS